MRKKSFILALILLAMFFTTSIANAVIMSSQYINSYGAAAGRSGNKITVTFDITGKTTMDVIGAKTIIIQEKASGSSSWNAVATLTSDNYSNMLGYNKRDQMSSVYYYGAKEDCSYRAKVYFYAEKGGYDTREYITDPV